LQSSQATHSGSAWESAAIRLPSAHGVHTRSRVSVGTTDWYSPGPHCLHCVQLPALVAMLNCPASQLLHMRSCVAEGCCD
jgi:hypothetical protein